MKATVPGALRFDIDEISDHKGLRATTYVATRPDRFDEAMQDLGVGAGMQVIVYDSLGFQRLVRGGCSDILVNDN